MRTRNTVPPARGKRRNHQSKLATYDELLSELEQKKNELLLYQAALSGVVAGPAQATVSCAGEDGKPVKFQLFDAERAHGGVVLEVHEERGHRSYVRPWYLTQLLAPLSFSQGGA